MKEMLMVKDLKVVFGKNGEKTTAVNGLSFNIKENEFVCLFGVSGCGKTTTLNTIAGFIKPQKGTILLEGKEIFEPNKEIGIVFQHHALFPWKTVKENIEIGPKLNNVNKVEREKIVKTYLKAIGLESFENHYPNELSGGMQQRVGIARALANNPKIILMDEPFGSLDSITRTKMQEQLLDIWKKHKKTVIFVTHDVDEALILSDRILVMDKNSGKIKKEIKNNLPRPRSYKLSTNPKYLKQRKEILEMLL